MGEREGWLRRRRGDGPAAAGAGAPGGGDPLPARRIVLSMRPSIDEAETRAEVLQRRMVEMHALLEPTVTHGGDCVEVHGFRVTDAGRWPVVLRAATGRLRDVAVEADEVVFDGQLAIHDVWFRAEEIGVAPLRFGLDGGDAEIRGGRSSATLRFADLERAVANLGVDATLRWDGPADSWVCPAP